MNPGRCGHSSNQSSPMHSVGKLKTLTLCSGVLNRWCRWQAGRAGCHCGAGAGAVGQQRRPRRRPLGGRPLRPRQLDGSPGAPPFAFLFGTTSMLLAQSTMPFIRPLCRKPEDLSKVSFEAAPIQDASDNACKVRIISPGTTPSPDCPVPKSAHPHFKKLHADPGAALPGGLGEDGGDGAGTAGRGPRGGDRRGDPDGDADAARGPRHARLLRTHHPPGATLYEPRVCGVTPTIGTSPHCKDPKLEAVHIQPTPATKCILNSAKGAQRVQLRVQAHVASMFFSDPVCMSTQYRRGRCGSRIRR